MTQEPPGAGTPLAPPAEPSQPADAEDIGTFHAFRYRNYRLLWAGHLFTAAAQSIQQTVLGWVGGLFGGLLTASLNRVDRRDLLQIIALLVFSLSETAFSILAWWTGNLWVAVPFLVIVGAAESLYTTTNTTVLQLLAPSHLCGSMASVLQLSFLLMPLVGLGAGAAADWFGAPAVGATITFAAFTIGTMMLVLSPALRGLRLSALQEQA